ncbi:response regulator transcription factor [Nocardioidaceae bacterium]|nr:response regulator transcription factor [Nocardioidaceae bacterium]
MSSLARTPVGVERRLRRVLVVDDHEAICDLLATVMTPERGLECIGTAVTADRALRLLSAQRPDVVLMDVRLGSDDGIALTRVIVDRDPAVAVVLLTGLPVQDLLSRALASGASALLEKSRGLSEVFDAIHRARPGIFSSPSGHLLGLARSSGAATEISLTPREREVLEMLAAGRDISTISRSLAISIHTGRGHVKSLLGKLGVHSQLQAVAKAHELGLVHTPASQTDDER